MPIWDNIKKNIKEVGNVAAEKAEELGKVAATKTEELTKAVSYTHLTLQTNREE